MVQAAEGGQISGGEDSVVLVTVFRVGGLRSSVIARPRFSPGQRRANPSHTLHREEPLGLTVG